MTLTEEEYTVEDLTKILNTIFHAASFAEGTPVGVREMRWLVWDARRRLAAHEPDSWNMCRICSDDTGRNAAVFPCEEVYAVAKFCEMMGGKL